MFKAEGGSTNLYCVNVTVFIHISLVPPYRSIKVKSKVCARVLIVARTQLPDNSSSTAICSKRGFIYKAGGRLVYAVLKKKSSRFDSHIAGRLFNNKTPR
jgi:hypothetical protein